MRALSSLGVGLSLVAGFLLLALIAELYYLLWWKKRVPGREVGDGQGYFAGGSPARELLYLFCWKKPSCLAHTAALNPQEICGGGGDDRNKDLLLPFGGEEGMEAELMRLHSLSGPPRFLFTIKEETREDLESDDGKSRAGGGGRSRKSSRGQSLSETPPFMTPLSSPPFFTPPLTPNPLYESGRSIGDEVAKSPPPKFKFLRDAEEKLYKKTLTEEAMRLHKMNAAAASPSKSPSKTPTDDEDGSFITIVIGKNSQVNPLPSHGKLGAYLRSSQV